MKTHLGSGMATVCGASPLVVKSTTGDMNAVDCLGCLWAIVANHLDQFSRGMERIRILSNEAINQAEYRLNPKVLE